LLYWQNALYIQRQVESLYEHGGFMRIRRQVVPDPGRVATNRVTADRVAANRVAEVVHAAPVGGFSFTPCCDRTLTELPPYDRISRRPSEVTCGRLSETDELLLSGAPLRSRQQNTEQLIYQMAMTLRSMRGPRLSLDQALGCVQAAVRELAPARHSDEHWSASLLIQLTARADELAS
jgi:hypothetical protein